MRLEASGYRRLRGAVSAIVKAVGADDTVIFADAIALGNAAARRAFTRALMSRLNGTGPAEDAIERELLALMRRVEEELANDPQPSAPAVAPDEERVENYLKTPAGFVEVKTRETPGGPVEYRVQLANFTAEIFEDVTIDDGAERRREFGIVGELAGRPLPPVRVPAESFASMAWVTKSWGVRARVAPGLGRRDVLRDCIQAFSTAAVERVVFAHTGWRREGDRWLYLHAGGAIGAKGLIQDVHVELDDRLGRYELPEPPEGPRLADAVRASWELWGVTTPEVAAVFLGGAYTAPLAEFLEPDFSIWALGSTGKLKTSYAALVTAHFGDFDVKHLPDNWESTANALEKRAFLAKDVLFLIDDYRPPADRHEAVEMRRKAGRLVRSAGNRSGRSRMAGDTSLRPMYYPRGIVVSTAEERITGESAMARRWEVPFDAGTVDLGRLTTAQERTDHLRAAMAGYVRWLAARLDRDGSTWLLEIQRQAHRAAVGVGGHLRHPQTYAALLTGWLVFAEFAQMVCAVTPAEAKARLRDVDAALRRVAEQQAIVARETKPEIVFLATLADLLAGGKAHLAAPDGGPPPDALAWGWQRIDTGTGTIDRPAGDKLGWVDDDCIFLIPSVAHRLIARTIGDRGESFIISPHALHRALGQSGYLVPSGGGERTRPARLEGRTVRVLALNRQRVERLWSGES